MRVISFCIYGSEQKYCKGLLENIEIIKNKLPDFYIFIYVGNEVPEYYINLYKDYNKVKLFFTNINGYNNRIYRFFAIDETDVDVMIVRDVDSRIHNRDIWCILHFINSKYYAHTIRDHPEHRTQIMGGLWGLKKGLLNKKMKDIYLQYNKNEIDHNEVQYDQIFLKEILYNGVVKYMIVYLNNIKLRLRHDENIFLIPFKIINNQFCGQVVEYNNNKPFLKYNIEENGINNLGIPNLKNMSKLFKK